MKRIGRVEVASSWRERQMAIEYFVVTKREWGKIETRY